MRTARQLASEGRFDALADAAPHPELNGFFKDDLAKRTSSPRVRRRANASVARPAPE